MPVTTWLDGRPYTSLKGAAFLFLSETGHVIVPTEVSDSGGGATTTWVQGIADIPCRVDIARGFEQLVAERISERTTHILVIPANVDLTEEDRFAVEGRGTFEVTGVYRHTGETGKPIRTLEIAEM